MLTMVAVCLAPSGLTEATVTTLVVALIAAIVSIANAFIAAKYHRASQEGMADLQRSIDRQNGESVK